MKTFVQIILGVITTIVMIPLTVAAAKVYGKEDEIVTVK